MYQIQLILCEKIQKKFINTFYCNYPNYTIDFVNSKEIPSNCSNKERNLLWICDRDEDIKKLKESYHNAFPLPVIAYSHEGNQEESLIAAPWMILSPSDLTPDLITEVISRYTRTPLLIGETDRCLIRELAGEDLKGLLALSGENRKNPGGCFFPENCAAPDQFLKEYIGHQYYYYGFGLYGIFIKPELSFAGIAGFSGSIFKEVNAEISYALLKKYQGQGYAREALTFLLSENDRSGFPGRILARIDRQNLPSIALAKDLGIQIFISG